MVAGTAAALVTAVWSIRGIRPALLFDSEPSWTAARLALMLAVAGIAAAAAGVVGGALFFWSGTPSFDRAIDPLPFSRRALVGVAAGAAFFGAAARAVSIRQIPWPLWVDDLSLIAPTRALAGGWGDFSDPVRAAPYGVAHPFGTVGVAYLELWRLGLEVFGTNVFGIRFPSLAAGVLSLATAGLLARELLPRGGGAAAVVALAGLRWSLILSRWGWVAIALAPVLDVATLLLLRARRRSSPALAAAAGGVAGLGAHIYLAAWIGGSALLVFAAWPAAGAAAWRRRAWLPAAFALGFVFAAAPLLVARREASVPYFARAGDHNVVMEMRRTASPMPFFSAAADAIASPWLAPDPTPRNDIPGRSRLGWILGIPVAAILARALVVPREELSGWLLAHAGAAAAAAVAAGQATNPNGFRYAYLTTVTAVAAAAGALWLLGFVARARRRLFAVAALGLAAAGALAAARDTLLVWGESRETFDAFHGEDTLIGRAAARWDRYGEVAVAPDLGFDPRTHSPITIGVVRRERLEAGEGAVPEPASRRRSFRIVAPGTPGESGERRVERVRDGWGRERAVIFGRRGTKPPSPLPPAGGEPG
ncbi:MAG: hypothetical protein ACM3SU_00055 [Acidobacteriota bacterium]